MTDAQQFEVFMRNYQDMVFSTALRLVANAAEAEDISQEVFLKAYERFPELQDSPTAGGWLKTVARNLSLNHLTRYRARWSFFSEMFSSDTPDPEEREIEFPAATDIEEEIAAADRHALVETALRSLPATQRVPLVLYHLEGLSYEEIASKLNVSLGKVKTDIFRGREALRKKLRLRLAGESEGGGPGLDRRGSQPVEERTARTLASDRGENASGMSRSSWLQALVPVCRKLAGQGLHAR